jgi:16S rRNA (guanine527-N7)-methyltransferase
MTPSRASLQAILERCGTPLTDLQYDQLWAYHRLLREANTELNLTRIHNFENMVLKHYVDSLLVLKYEDLPSPLVDMGSGPGLPGIPLKIARPEVAMVLAEPRGARAEFLERVCAQLGLTSVEVYANKVGPRFPLKVASVITRAVAAIPETLERVAEILEPGRRVLFMKGPNCDDEIAAAARGQAAWFRLRADHVYAIPGTPHARRLVVYERLAERATTSRSRPVREVASESNPTYQLCRDVLTGRGIRKHGCALLAGLRPTAEVLARFPERVEAWITGPAGPPPPFDALDWIRLNHPLFQVLDPAGTHAPLLLVRVPAFPAWSAGAPWAEGCTLFVPFQDPENVGAVVRSAVAFGVGRVVLLREAAHPFHPKAARAAGTALFQVEFWQGPSIQDLDPGAAPLLALSAEGEDLATCSFPERFGLVPGLEGPGLPQRMRRGGCMRIPIAPGVDSLNAAAATAVALYEWRRRLQPTPGPSAPPEPGGAAPAE